MEYICPACKKNSTKSQMVEIFHGSAKTGLENQYVDEEGRNHWHNPTVSISVYRCSNGHEIKYIRHANCSTCGWNTGNSKIEVVEYFLHDLGIASW